MVVTIKGITVVNLDVCVGYYADLRYKLLSHVKNNQIKLLIEKLEQKPDLIVGDFSAENNLNAEIK
jgi:hypothetical protein